MSNLPADIFKSNRICYCCYGGKTNRDGFVSFILFLSSLNEVCLKVVHEVQLLHLPMESVRFEGSHDNKKKSFSARRPCQWIKKKHFSRRTLTVLKLQSVYRMTAAAVIGPIWISHKNMWKQGLKILKLVIWA